MARCMVVVNFLVYERLAQFGRMAFIECNLFQLLKALHVMVDAGTQRLSWTTRTLCIASGLEQIGLCSVDLGDATQMSNPKWRSQCRDSASGCGVLQTGRSTIFKIVSHRSPEWITGSVAFWKSSSQRLHYRACHPEKYSVRFSVRFVSRRTRDRGFMLHKAISNSGAGSHRFPEQCLFGRC
jgi:hypothetical protein